MMVKYELKKIFGNAGSRIALMILAGIVVMSCWLAASIEWINEQGDPETGTAAVQKLYEAQNQWEGPLTEETLRKVLEENQRINATPEAQSKDFQQNDIAYGWKQGFKEIRNLINNSYAEGFRSYDYYRADSVTPDEVSSFYSNRIQNLEQWLYDEQSGAYDMYSEQEKQFLLQQYEKLETPFYYDYNRGWVQLCGNSQYIIIIGALVLGYLVSGIFSNEFKWRSDAVYFTTVYGRNRATAAKLKAGFWLVSALYWISILIYTLFVLCFLGFEGADCPVQADYTGWKCFYNITLLQKYLLIILGGYIGNLFFAFLSMWFSAKTRSAIFAVTVPFVLIFLPSILENLDLPALNDILGLLPDRMLQINMAINYFDLYSFGKNVCGAIPILFVLYSLLTVVLLPMMYQEFRKKQVG